ncbi:MAG: DUF6655 family protein [Planctomycetota bacterium]
MTRALLLLLAPFVLSACTVRETTTPRTATEVLLLSTAAERAIARFDAAPLKGKRVAIDDSRYDAVDKPYVISALRTQVVRGGGRLVKDLRKTKPDAPAPEAILELRNATLGLWDGAFTFGIPPVPISRGVGQEPLRLPGFYLLHRGSQQGYCKLQLYAYEVATGRQLQRVEEVWGHSYYNQWWFLGFGPFLGSQDIYPERVE